MNKRRRRRPVSTVALAFTAALVVVLAFLVRLSLHRPPAVELPEIEDASKGGGASQGAPAEAIRRVEVTPETVQRVIERLARPARYSRTLTMERFWTDGSAVATATVLAADGWMRLDVERADAETRHVITGNGQVWVWYDDERRVYTGAEPFTADEELGVPTYEDVLALPASAIADAGYCVYEGANCIYVETEPDDFGCRERWWVGVDDGLLAGAERLEGARVIYTVRVTESAVGSVDTERFLLPDGSAVYTPRKDEEES